MGQNALLMAEGWQCLSVLTAVKLRTHGGSHESFLLLKCSLSFSLSERLSAIFLTGGFKASFLPQISLQTWSSSLLYWTYTRRYFEKALNS